MIHESSAQLSGRNNIYKKQTWVVYNKKSETAHWYEGPPSPLWFPGAMPWMARWLWTRKRRKSTELWKTLISDKKNIMGKYTCASISLYNYMPAVMCVRVQPTDDAYICTIIQKVLCFFATTNVPPRAETSSNVFCGSNWLHMWLHESLGPEHSQEKHGKVE